MASISKWISKLALLPLLASAGQIAQGQIAQSKDTVPTIRTETRAVQIDVSVRDSHGAPVRRLTKDDFSLFDDGRPRPIAFFSAEVSESVKVSEGAPDKSPPDRPAPSAATPPASPSRILSNTAPSNVSHEAVTVILLDATSPTLDLTTGALGMARGLGSGFLALARDQVFDVMAELPVKERIAIYQMSPGGLKIVQDFTTDRDLLRKSVTAWSVPVDWKPVCGPTTKDIAQEIAPRRAAQAPAASNSGVPASAGDFLCPVFMDNSIRMGVISVLDSMNVIGEQLARLPGRKNLLWVTPGFPMRWLLRLDAESQQVLAQLNNANVALNAIDVRGVGGRIDEQEKVMQTMAESTGGKAYFGNDIAAAIREADDTARANYTLGFYLADNERDGNFHKLELRIDRAGLSLSYRKGYAAEKVSGGTPAVEPERAPGTELLNPVDAAAVGISGAADVTPGEPHPTLHLKLSLDPRGLTLRPRDNGSVFKITRMFAERDARGATLVEGQDSKEFVVPAESLDAIYREGIHWEQALPLMPGAATVRVIVRDEATGQAGTLTVPVPDAH